MKILLIQNSARDARALRAMLREPELPPMDLAHVPRLSDALKRLRRERFDAVLIDPGPPDARGLETLRRVQESLNDLPVVVLHGGPLGLPGEGGLDKGNVAREARSDIRLLVETLRRAIERKRAEQLAEFMAYHDALTNLPNRRLLLDRLSQAILRSRRVNKKVALLFLDLDDFKAVNDTLGHAAGDRLLSAIADRLTRGIRAADTLARLGGDEFTIVLSEIATAAEASRFARKMQDLLATPVRVEGRSLTVSVSIGVSLYPDHGDTAEALLRSADEAMYRAKHRDGKIYQLNAGRRGTGSLPVRAHAAESSTSLHSDRSLRSQVEELVTDLRRRSSGRSAGSGDYLQTADRLIKALEKWANARASRRLRR